MKKIIVLSILLIIGNVVFAQSQDEDIAKRPLNNINLNLLSDASLISINYERLFPINSKFIISSEIGLGFNKELGFCYGNSCSPPERFLTIPYHITGNFGKEKHFFEFGLGGTVFNGMRYQPYLVYPMIGYRFIPLKATKYNFRVLLQIPFTGLEMDGVYFIPVGISTGICF